MMENYHVIFQKSRFLKEVSYFFSVLKKVFLRSFLNPLFTCYTVIQP